jgi:hypothetical protein
VNTAYIFAGGWIFCALLIVYGVFVQAGTINRLQEQCEMKDKVHIQIGEDHYCLNPGVLEKIQ